MKNIIVLIFLLLCILTVCIYPVESAQSGELYLGLKPPENLPVIFAPGVISTRLDESSIFFSPDGFKIYFTREYTKLMVVIKKGYTWGKPVEVTFGGKTHQIGEANISPQGDKIYFNTRKPVPGGKTALTLWVAEKTAKGWGKAQGLRPPVNDQVMHSVAIFPDGSICAGGLKTAKWDRNHFIKPARIGIKGDHPFISKDGKYMIFDTRQPQGYAADLYITYKQTDGSWGTPRNLEGHVNTAVGEVNGAISPDNKYLFFTRKGNIYWVKNTFLKNDIK